jgi:hypothetical protein
VAARAVKLFAEQLIKSAMRGLISVVRGHAIEAVATVGAAIGTVVVAILAIWGDFFRFKWAGPKLLLSLDDPRGNLFPRANGMRAYFFHLKVKNRRLWSPAKDVRVLVERAARRKPDGSFGLVPLVYPLPLAWTPRELGDFLRTVFDTEICDVGFLDQNSDRFVLATLFTASNFQNFVVANDAIRLRILALGQNAMSKPLFLEITWYGNWTADRDAMQNHLVVKPIEEL